MSKSSGAEAISQDEVPELDVDLLNSIRGLSNKDSEDFLTTLIKLFLKRVPELRLVIDQAIGAQDTLALEEAAHALKGNCANLGATRLAKLCEGVEDLGHQGTTKGAKDLMEHFDRDFIKIKEVYERDWIQS